MKRFSIVLALVLALCLAFVGSAYANFGPHGGYVNDTDACAGCHRAHTSFSPVTWTDGSSTPTTHTALLVGSAQTMTEFCDACHGDLAPGASTNVVSGVFDSGPSGAAGAVVGTVGEANGVTDGGNAQTTAYLTASVFNAPLNGGGFARMPDPYQWQTSTTIAYKAATSAHRMDTAGPLWGAGNSVAEAGSMTLDCTSCHDPHGTSNFRLLKAQVNGTTVGGYQADGLTPNAFVFSNEIGYPIPGVDPDNMVGGWLKHEAGAAQMAAYRPNYTDTTGTVVLHQDNSSSKSLSVWCSACHQQYNVRTSSYDYTPYEPGAAAPNVGNQLRHRHPVDIVPGTNATDLTGTVRTLTELVVEDSAWVPLEHNVNPAAGFDQNWIGCLTCHRAHGSSVDMTGWAAAHLEQNSAGTWAPVRDGIAGVDPTKNDVPGSNLLRADNRGVCERCHNK